LQQRFLSLTNNGETQGVCVNTEFHLPSLGNEEEGMKKKRGIVAECILPIREMWERDLESREG
jgi:hypothetical protein